MSKSRDTVLGAIRIQVLSNTLIRIEKNGPGGFENRVTFNVVNRDWPGPSDNRLRVIIPDGESIKGVRIETDEGAKLYECDGKVPPMSYLPPPGRVPTTWVMPDAPRIIPPAWGATPAPDDRDPASGWDVSNLAEDFYVFMPGAGGYAQLLADFLKLTGPIPMLPLYAFGFWDSRWFPYTEKSALEVIDTYRRKKFPLDVFVVDTDWRVGASHGYDISTQHFPDMAQFIRKAHARHVRLMYNDHPEPVGQTALDPKELKFRNEGLTSLLKLGADVWWYDRNWHKHLHEPAPGLRKEVWGMRMFHDITQRCRPGERPLIMSNAQGVDNGWRAHPSDPAAHRYPIWWTGDTVAEWATLPQGIANGVDLGLLSLLPYVNEDLGGHDFRGLMMMPTPELYVRFLQFGCFSPITRIHCTARQTRYPWVYGKQAEAIVKDFIQLRYRLLPTLYAAARRAHEDGTPLLRRCDLEWPSYAEAADNQQYLFGDDLLVAPVNETNSNVGAIPESMLQTPDGFPGLRAHYFGNTKLSGGAIVERIDRRVAMAWANWSKPDAAPAGKFSVRWTGTLGPVPATGTYEIGLNHTDGVKLWIDGALVINSWKKQPLQFRTKKIKLIAGRRHEIRIEHFTGREASGVALIWRQQSSGKPSVRRSLWIPPGGWQDAWTGERFTGPRKIIVDSPLWHMPMFMREGGIVLTVPQMRHTGEKKWDTIVVDAMVPKRDASSTRILYEDDGHSTNYLTGAFRKTRIALARRGRELQFIIDKATGDFEGQPESRTWIIRLHFPRGAAVRIPEARILRAAAAAHVMPFHGRGSKPGRQSGPIAEFEIRNQPASKPAELVIKI